MKIAVIGWGSLIYSPGKLKISSGWKKDGPVLPIEFLRVSKDGRLTLVINPQDDAACVTTLWAISFFDDIQKAINNLRDREGTIEKHIGFVISKETDNKDPIKKRISDWLTNGRQQIDAAVYTNLPPKNSKGEEKKIMVWADIVGHIENNKRNKEIENYVRNAPEQIETPIRKLLRDKYHWENKRLCPKYFDDI